MDVCIIGAGPAGAILAAELAEREHAVVILDAGPRFDDTDREKRMERELRPSFRRSDVWDMGGPRDAFSVSGPINYDMNATRVKGVGGTTLHWQGQSQRLHPEDFEMESRHGVADDWPISYDDLEPYYTMAEQELGVAGAPSPFGGERSGPYPMEAHERSYLDQVLQAGFTSNDIELHACPMAINSQSYDGRPACQGFGTCNPVCPSRAKYSAEVHIDRAEAAGATIITNAPVARLAHDDAGERVTAAMIDRPGTPDSVRARTFVIAAGGIETARLLLLSASSSHPDGLANGSGLVGRRFMEHPSVKLEARLDKPSRQHLIGFDTSISEQYYGHDDGPTGSMVLQIDNDHGDTPAEAALAGGTTLNRMLNEPPGAALRQQTFGDALLDHVSDRYGHGIGIVAMVEQLPDPENRITLSDDVTDDEGNPGPDLHFRVGSDTQETLTNAMEVLSAIVDALPVSDVREIGTPRTPSFVFHHMGTARMGEDRTNSVVDADLRAHEVDNLYLSSSAVFVTSGAAPPTLTIAALTLRLADHLDERLS